MSKPYCKQIMNTMVYGIGFNKRLFPLTDENIWFHGCRNITNRNNVVFPNAKKVVFKHCDTNFIYYWFDQRTFPLCKTFYIFSNQFELSVLNRIPDVRIFIDTDVYMNFYVGNRQLNSPIGYRFFPHVYPLSQKELDEEFDIKE